MINIQPLKHDTRLCLTINFLVLIMSGIEHLKTVLCFEIFLIRGELLQTITFKNVLWLVITLLTIIPYNNHNDIIIIFSIKYFHTGI